jgi:hypothetical protein
MAAVSNEDIDARRERVEVTVRTPAGASHRFDLDLDELVAEVVATEIEFFVKRNELGHGDYGLAVIRGGQAEPMADTSRLAEYHIIHEDVLVLIPEAPQVDG